MDGDFLDLSTSSVTSGSLSLSLDHSTIDTNAIEAAAQVEVHIPGTIVVSHNTMESDFVDRSDLTWEPTIERIFVDVWV